MFRSAILCAAFICATPLSAQSLVGKWDCEGRDGNSRAIRTLQEYKANGIFYHLANLAMGDRTGRMDVSLSMRGKWERSSDHIVEIFSSVKLRSITRDGQDLSKTPQGRELRRDLPGNIFGPSRRTRTHIAFTGPNRFEVKGRMSGFCQRR